MSLIRQPNKQQIEILKSGLINRVKELGKNNAVFSLRDGNIFYTLLFCSEGLKLYGRYNNYSKCFLTIKENRLNKELREVLK